jgi:hypothetical protein
MKLPLPSVVQIRELTLLTEMPVPELGRTLYFSILGILVMKYLHLLFFVIKLLRILDYLVAEN